MTTIQRTTKAAKNQKQKVKIRNKRHEVSNKGASESLFLIIL